MAKGCWLHVQSGVLSLHTNQNLFGSVMRLMPQSTPLRFAESSKSLSPTQTVFNVGLLGSVADAFACVRGVWLQRAAVSWNAQFAKSSLNLSGLKINSLPAWPKSGNTEWSLEQGRHDSAICTLKFSRIARLRAVKTLRHVRTLVHRSRLT